MNVTEILALHCHIQGILQNSISFISVLLLYNILAYVVADFGCAGCTFWSVG